MKRLIYLILPVLLTLTMGFVASQMQTEALALWYPLLLKPVLTPPNIVFPIAWSVLYVLIGLSLGWVLMGQKNLLRSKLVIVWGIQLLVNFLWSFMFFYLQNPLAGLVNIVILDILVSYYTINAYKINKIATWIFMPYLIWILFATYLNAYIWLYN